VICELIGPMGVGKTTVTPLLAAKLDIPYYRGQAFHGLDDQPLTTPQIWADRTLSLVRNPRLAVAAMRAHDGSITENINFALNTCRRDRLEARAARAGQGIVESGPVHAICQVAAWIELDLSELGDHIHRADVYVRLRASDDVVTRRLDGRGQLPPWLIDRHHDWITRYDENVDRMLARLERPVLEIDANDNPETVVERIAKAIAPLVD
jgi:adenylate kinase family enzyme